MGKQTADSASIKLLWTGGWDSTFRLLCIVFLERRRVQPYFIKFGIRSFQFEIDAMDRIRDMIRSIDEPSAALILPTRFFEDTDIPTCKEITQAYRNIRKTRFIGTQYRDLAALCEWQQISSLQLCIHKEDIVKSATAIESMLTESGENPQALEIDSEYSKTDEYVVFKYFEFPVLGLTKVAMDRMSAERGWAPIMDLTWFCHHPINGKPCGRCNPCSYTIEEGLGRRIPVQRRVVVTFQRWANAALSQLGLLDAARALRKRLSKR